MTGRRPSVYEGRFTDRVRRLFGRDRRDPRGREIIVNSNGSPRLVIERGELVGLRTRDGGVFRFPPCCDNPLECRRAECWTKVVEAPPGGPRR